MSGVSRVWDPFLTEQDRAHLALHGGRAGGGFGSAAAIISVDNYRNAVGDEPLPLLESIKLWPSSTGLAGWAALDRIAELFASARAADIPIVHITGLAPEDSGIGGWGRGPRSRPLRADADAAAAAAAVERHSRRYEFSAQAAPLPGEAILQKTAPSAFFGTPLVAHLNALGVDTLIICGESTSGCVRATVVDACAYRFRVVVVEECVYDRHEATHALNLFDMDQKYADVLPLVDVTDWMASYRR